MSVQIPVPPLGESVVQATVGTILKASGSVVREGEEILELETDKVNQVLYAPALGKLSLSVKSGDTVKVGQVIGSLEPGVAPEATAPSKEEPAKASSELATAAPALAAPASTVPPPKVPEAPKSVDGRRKKMTKLRRVIAERLVQVKNQTAMLTTFNEVDMSSCITLREKIQAEFQQRHGVKLGFMSLFIKATAAALKEFPDINARIEGDEIVYPETIDIGVAVSTDKGLMVPVLRDVEKFSHGDIEKQLKTFAEKARDGTIAVNDLQGGTFTITNGGVFGSLLSTPILNPPQSGILGMHSIVKRPVAVNDAVVIRPMMYVALSYDHRIVDGKEAIGFLVHIKKSLEGLVLIPM